MKKFVALLLISSLIVPLQVRAELVINEILALNVADQEDDNESQDLADIELETSESDWLEIYNNGDEDVDITGWFLTTKPSRDIKKWQPIIGKAIVPKKGYLVVRCGKKNTLFKDRVVYAKVSLSTSGDTIVLANPKGEIIDKIAFGTQFANTSYGINQNGEMVYFKEPTPGEANITKSYKRQTPSVTFSVPHGYKTESFDLELECPRDPNATIYYTLDGSSPSKNSPRYEAPISISKTTSIRAVAIDEDSIFQTDNSATYIFVRDVKTGLPVPSTIPASANKAKAVTNRAPFEAAFKSSKLPTIALTCDMNQIYDEIESSGNFTEYDEADVEEDIRAIAEFISPDGDFANEFTISSGFRLRHGMQNPEKPSFRLRFKSEYGIKELIFPLFGDSASGEYKRLDLRAISFPNILVETFARDSMRDLGQPYERSRFCHLFVNGVYYGIYEILEHANEQFASTYLGGKGNDWDVINNGIVDSGDGTGWNNLWDIVTKEGFDSDYAGNFMRLQGLNPSGTSNYGYKPYLNLNNLLAYTAVTTYLSCTNTPTLALYRPNDRATKYAGFNFILNDLLSNTKKSQNSFDNDSTTLPEYANLGAIDLHNALLKDKAYRRIFSDAIYTFCARENSPLSKEASLSRIHTRIDELDDAMVAEILTYELPNDIWEKEKSNIDHFFQPLTDNLLATLRENKLMPSTPPPVASDNQGTPLPARCRYRGPVTLTLKEIASNSKIYYCLGSCDPCTSKDEISPLAIEYTTPIEITGRTRLRARTLSQSGEWSPLVNVDLN